MIRVVATALESDARRLVLEVPGWPAHRPGQFAMLELDPGREHLDPLLPRPMAVYRASGTQVEFRFEPVGRGTRRLGSLSHGAPVGVVGPLGNGFEAADDPAGGASALLVGGGTGIASLYELARGWSGARVRLGARSRERLLGLADFERLDLDLGVATDDGSLGRRGAVTELVAPRAGDRVFACGPTPMLRRVAGLAAAAGARCWVSLETRMACGFGVCLGCVVPTREGFRYLCTQGPVFAAESLDWEGLA